MQINAEYSLILLSLDAIIVQRSLLVYNLVSLNTDIGVGRGGARGGQAPPNNLRGGANIPFGPPNNPPTCTGKSIPLNSILEFSIILYIKMRNVIIWHLFIKIYWAHDVEMTSMRRRYVASTSLRRHVPAGNLAPPLAPPPIF